MREMKDSGIEWIGEIPVGWKISTIKKEYQFQTGATPKTDIESYFEGENIWVNISDMKSKTVYDSAKHISDEAVNNTSMTVSSKGSLMYAFKLSVGAVSFCGKDMYTNEAIATFMKGENSLDYLYYSAPIFIIMNANENIYGAKLLNQQLIRNAKIIVPPLEEQHRISTYLDTKCEKIDSIIVRQQEVIEKLKAYKLSVITEVVTKGLNPDVRMKDSGVEWIGEVPEHWEIGKIKNFCELKTGGTPSTTNQEWFDGKIQWFTPGDFSEKYILNTSSRNLSQLAIEDGVATLFPEKTVMIVGIGATAGKIGFSPMQSYCNQQITALITNSILSKYLMYWMIANTKFLRETAMFTTLPILNNQTIGNYLCVIPKSITEQQQIADYLDKKCSAIDSAIAKKQAIIEKLTAYKKSLIYEVVTGKREV